MIRFLTKYFVRGLLIVVPVAVTLFVIYRVLNWVDGLLGPVLERYHVAFPGVGLVLTLLLITIAGLLASNLIAQQLLRELDSMVAKLPLVKLVYGSIRDLIAAFAGDKKRFDQPAMVELYPGARGKVLGFVTRTSMGHIGLPDHVAVYFPQSYNFGGTVLVLPRERVTPLQTESGALMAFIISGGVAGEQDATPLPAKRRG
jgi:uncharacterized membrane protein